MRAVVPTWFLIVLLAACQNSPKAVVGSAAERGASALSEKIPITSRSQQAIALFLRARAHNENLQPHEGHALFQEAVAIDTAFAMGEYGLASTAPTAKEVREHLTRAIALSRSVSQGEQLLMRAMQARIDADPAAVRMYAESLVTRYPADERAHWVLGNAYSAQQQYGKAVEQFRRAIAINPQYSLAYNSVGYADRAAGDNLAAEQAFLQYIALVPSDPNPYDSYAELLMKLGRFDESIAQYQKALSIDPHFSGSFVGIAANHMLAGRYPAAIAEAERYFRVARDDHERRAALQTLALIYVDKGATDDAMRTMARERNIARAIGDSASMSADDVAIADILLEAGRVDESEVRFRNAHALVAASSLSANLKKDSDLLSHFNMARVALARNNTARAEIEANSFASIATSARSREREQQSHELNGLVLLESKRYEQCLAELRLADLQSPAVLFAMSLAHRAMDDGPTAETLRNSALHSNILPTFPYVFARAKIKARPNARAVAK